MAEKGEVDSRETMKASLGFHLQELTGVRTSPKRELGVGLQGPDPLLSPEGLSCNTSGLSSSSCIHAAVSG